MPSMLPSPEFVFYFYGTGAILGPSLALRHSKLSKGVEPFLSTQML